MSQSPSPVHRLPWIDRARGLAMLLVVVYHAGYYAAMHVHVPEWFQALHLALAPFRMPMLMLLAGLFLGRALGKGAGEFVQAKLRQLLWPFAIWTVISCFAAGTPELLLQLKVWRGGGYLWFIVFLFAYFMVGLLVRRVPHLLVALVALVISILARDGSKHGEQLFMLMACFFVGAFLGQHLQRLDALLADRRSLLLLLPAMVVAAGSVLTGAVRFNPLWFVLIVPALVGVQAVVWRIGTGWLQHLLEFVGRHSVVFYLANTPIYKGMIPVLLAAGVPAAGIVPASLLLALGVPMLLALARPHWAGIALLFEFPRRSRTAHTPAPAGALQR